MPTHIIILSMSHFPPEKIDTDIKFLKGVGPKRAELFAKLEVYTVGDLLYHFPRRYLDRSLIRPIAELKVGENVTAIGKVVTFGVVDTRKQMTIFNLILQDESSYIYCKWFNQKNLKKVFKVGQIVVVSGEVSSYQGDKQFVTPEFEILADDQEDEMIHTGRIVPLYPATAGLFQKNIRQAVKNALDQFLQAVPETLPSWLLERYQLLDLQTALTHMHYPESTRLQELAHRRLAFEELFYLQMMLALRHRLAHQPEKGIVLEKRDTIVPDFYASLPFDLTNAQKRVIAEIEADLDATGSMNRLLHGDVGAGKTLVAVITMLRAVENGYQAALMAPTEILAEQHARKMIQYLDTFHIRSELLVGKMRAKRKKQVLADIQTGATSIIIGTHALIQEQVNFKQLGVVVIDEQHRFGVMQRAILREKGDNPNVLVMTATPIPRTLALTVYGDLDVSVVDELPAGREQIVTRWTTEVNRQKVYEFLRREIDKGRQVYVVYPLVEESEKIDLKAATEMYEKLQADVFPDLKIGLLHGRMKNDEKDAVMQEFVANRLHILVSTTVIEVGVDVANAAVMLIEHADRFGLTQLHQLRGRVGRGSYKSYCVLMASPRISLEAQERLDIIQSTTDGFKIAEEDLRLRGPGEFFGTRQHGLPELQVADILHDQDLLRIARQEAFNVVNKDPELKHSSIHIVRQNLQTKYHHKIQLANVG